MPEENRGRLVKRSLYEEYESERGGLCLDPHDPAFLGTITLALIALGIVGFFVKVITPQPTVIYPPVAPTIINN
jgi:hypothetical protein